MKHRIGCITVSGLALVLAAIGCERFTGGGWIVSPGDATKKATFGLELNCLEGDFDSEADAPDARLSGHLTFHDHGTLEAVAALGMVVWSMVEFEADDALDHGCRSIPGRTSGRADHPVLAG